MATWLQAVPVSNCRATNSPHTWWLRALIYLPSWASECELGPAGLLLVVSRVVVVRRWLGQQPEKACLGGGPRGPSPSHGGQWTLLWQALFTVASLGHTGFSPAWGRRPERVSENHEHPKGPRQRPPWVSRLLPPPATGYTGPARIQCGRATCSEHTGRWDPWRLAGWGGGHRGLPSPRGPRQGTEVSLPGQPWRCPSGSPGKQKQNGSGSPGDQLSSSFSANPSLTVNAPTTHLKCSLLGRPGEGVPPEEGTPPRLGSPQINSSDPTSAASHHCWHCCCFSRRLDKSAWGCGRRWRRDSRWVCTRRKPRRPPVTDCSLQEDEVSCFNFHGWQSQQVSPHRDPDASDVPTPGAS